MNTRFLHRAKPNTGRPKYFHWSCFCYIFAWSAGDCPSLITAPTSLDDALLGRLYITAHKADFGQQSDIFGSQIATNGWIQHKNTETAGEVRLCELWLVVQNWTRWKSHKYLPWVWYSLCWVDERLPSSRSSSLMWWRLRRPVWEHYEVINKTQPGKEVISKAQSGKRHL